MPVLTRFSVLALLLIVAPMVAQPLVLTGATVYDGTGADPMTDAVIVIEDERIACIGADCMAPDGAEIVDLAGRLALLGGSWLPNLLNTLACEPSHSP